MTLDERNQTYAFGCPNLLVPVILFCLVQPLIAAEQSSGRRKSDGSASVAMSILRLNCLSCHNEEKKKGGLQLTSRENALKGSDNGPVLVPRQADKSLLMKVLLPDSDPHMPPKKQLPEKDLTALRRWINAGATWDAKALAESSSDTKPIQLGTLPGSYHPVLALALAPDEKRLAVARANCVYVYDLSQTNYPIAARLEGSPEAIQSLSWSRDGQRLAAGGFRRIVLWSAPGLTQQMEITNQLAGRITSLQFTSNSTALLASDGIPTRSGVIHLLSIGAETNHSIAWLAHKDSIYALSLSPEEKRLATAGADKVIKVWDMTTQKEIAKLEAHTGHVLALAFSPDGNMLVSGSADKILNFWDTTNWHQAITLNNHPAPVTGLAWTSDGKSLMTTCEDGIARRFTEFKTHAGEQSGGGAQERACEKAADVLYCLATTADGKTVFGGCHNGLVYVWNAEGKITATFGSPEKEVAAGMDRLSK